MAEFRIVEQLRREVQRLHDGPPERTYRDLGEEFDVNHANLQNFLNGKKNIGIKSFAHICEILNLELSPIKQTKKRK